MPTVIEPIARSLPVRTSGDDVTPSDEAEDGRQDGDRKEPPVDEGQWREERQRSGGDRHSTEGAVAIVDRWKIVGGRRVGGVEETGSHGSFPMDR
jgi:hypothetical protein